MRKVKPAGVFGIAVMLLLFLSGCSGKQEAKEAAADQAEEYVYTAEFKSLGNDEDSVTSAVFGGEDTLYYVAAAMNKPQRLCAYHINEDKTEELFEEETASVSGLGTDNDGNPMVCLMTYAENAVHGGAESAAEEGPEIEAVVINTYGADGSVLKSLDAAEVLSGQGEDFYIQSILSDKDGNYYVCGGQSVRVLNPDGRLLFEASASTYITSMMRMPDGRIVIGYYGDNGWRLEEVNLSEKALKAVESKVSLDWGTYAGGRDTDLLFTQDTKLYSCNLKDEKAVEILNWLDCDIDSGNLQSFKMPENGKIAAWSLDWNAEKPRAELSVLTKKKRSEVSEKKTLTYGALYVPYYTNSDIVAFNKQSEKYRIEVKEYGDDSTDMETKLSLMNADISSGKGPDMIDLANSGVSVEDLISTGVLEDLSPYLEQDSELKREDYIENVLKMYERDGRLYAISPYYAISSLAGRVSDVGEESTWTVEDVIRLADSKPGDAELIPYVTKASMLSVMCSINLDEFVDRETGKCNFDSEGFKRVLEFANRFPKEANYDQNAPSEIERIRNGQLILTTVRISSVQLYPMYEYEYGEPVNFIGYPTMGKSGSTILPGGATVGMNVNSENKDGVWEFIRFNLTKERQDTIPNANTGFPIMKSSLEKQFEEDMTPEYYEEADGTKTEKPKSTWGNDEFTVDVFAAGREQVDRVREMIETAAYGSGTDEKMFAIIYEEAQVYFEGQKSVEDVASLIQNRVQTYINEAR